ncbi:MAG TPA: SMC-Scp complex subunit ScpB [Gammaproteobacteria bacterium]|nr:SMC-Scp complex subunit ScpB [Gammaproteobacteria bacterium]
MTIEIKNRVEALLLAAGKPLSVDQLLNICNEQHRPCNRSDIAQALNQLSGEYAGRSIELKEVSSGFRIQIRQEMAPWVARLWEEKPPRYSRALLETLALIAYRQPVTRAEIEEVRGVAVSSQIIKTLQEREWIRVIGHRDVPGRPAMFGTTKQFLDYFNLKRLDDLPTLAEVKDLESMHLELKLGDETPSGEAIN